MAKINHEDGRCVECGGHGYFMTEPAYLYGVGKIPCEACGGSGFLKAATRCEHCGAVKQPLREVSDAGRD